MLKEGCNDSQPQHASSLSLVVPLAFLFRRALVLMSLIPRNRERLNPWHPTSSTPASIPIKSSHRENPWVEPMFAPVEQRQFVPIIICNILQADLSSMTCPACLKYLPNPIRAVFLGSSDSSITEAGGCHYVGYAFVLALLWELCSIDT